MVPWCVALAATLVPASIYRPSQTYLVPAGTVITVQVQTAADTKASRVGEQITGRLLKPVVSQNDVELIPEGSKVFGTVTLVDPPAGPKPGRLEIRFTVIEHLRTGSKAMIRTVPAAFEGGTKKVRKFGVQKDRGTDAVLTPPAVVSCAMQDPLKVIIPKS